MRVSSYCFTMIVMAALLQSEVQADLTEKEAMAFIKCGPNQYGYSSYMKPFQREFHDDWNSCNCRAWRDNDQIIQVGSPS